MIMEDSIQNLILKMEVYMTKRGKDVNIGRELISAINDLSIEDSLDTIYVNDTDNFNIPDIAVIPLFNKDFNLFLMDGDLSNVCPFGYTIEFSSRVFDKYTPEELTAAVIHDVLQNVQSCTAKVRFLKAYNAAISEYKSEEILDMFDSVSNSEICFMAYMDICTRPFRVPVGGYDYVSTDDVLKTMKLDDSYNSYLDKALEASNDTPEQRIEQDTKDDYRTMKTILASCMDKDIRHYYAMIRNGVPLVTLDNIFGNRGTVASLGFISRKRDFKHRYEVRSDAPVTTAITESFLNPKTEVELRFQVDKIISDMRYAESEAEREVILIKIKTLTLKMTKTRIELDKKLQRLPQDKTLREQYEYVCNLIDELDMLRQKTLKLDIKEKRFGVFCQYPVDPSDPVY